MDNKTLQYACDYVNENAPELHGIKASKDLDVGPPIGPRDIVSSAIRDGSIVLIINRGIKGSPKYTIPLAGLERPAAKRSNKRRSGGSSSQEASEEAQTSVEG